MGRLASTYVYMVLKYGSIIAAHIFLNFNTV